MKENTRTIEQRLTRLEDAVFGVKSRGKSPSRSKAKSKASDFSGATGGVRFLISKGVFKKKKTLADVRTSLADHEYHYSAQAIQMALSRLTPKDGPLVSLREGGRKVYVERK